MIRRGRGKRGTAHLPDEAIATQTVRTCMRLQSVVFRTEPGPRRRTCLGIHK